MVASHPRRGKCLCSDLSVIPRGRKWEPVLLSCTCTRMSKASAADTACRERCRWTHCPEVGCFCASTWCHAQRRAKNLTSRRESCTQAAGVLRRSKMVLLSMSSPRSSSVFWFSRAKVSSFKWLISISVRLWCVPGLRSSHRILHALRVRVPSLSFGLSVVYKQRVAVLHTCVLALLWWSRSTGRSGRVYQHHLHNSLHYLGR